MELITVIVPLDEFKEHRRLFTFVEYKEVTIVDGFFDGDEIHRELKTASIKAYKRLKEYEFNKRNNQTAL